MAIGLAAFLALAAGVAGHSAPLVDAQPTAVSAGPDHAVVVVYRDRPVDTAELMRRSTYGYSGLEREGLALIVETRTVDLPAGEAIVRFDGLATGVVPQTAVIEGVPDPVIERNADFDLISPARLLDRSTGQTVRVISTDPVKGHEIERQAVLRAGARGAVLESEGGFEALNCSGLAQRIVFDSLPPGLSDKPTLSIRTRSEQAGRRQVVLAYLTTGLQWSADYVARLSADGRRLDLEGWITLANFQGTSFENAPVQVVAGDLRRDEDTAPINAQFSGATDCWPQARTDAVGLIAPTRKEDRVEYMAPAMMVDEIVVTGSRVMRRLAQQ
ncbi:hypothetical protein LTR94_027983, partial [Friedmanniomyces endolithicus]